AREERGGLALSQATISRCDHGKRDLLVPAASTGQVLKCPVCCGLVEVPRVALAAKKPEGPNFRRDSSLTRFGTLGQQNPRKRPESLENPGRAARMKGASRFLTC